jgi:hypothetical protein
MQTRDYASKMAKRGFRVFPIIPGTRLPFCSPEAKGYTKLNDEQKRWSDSHPSLCGGIHAATRSPELIERWFAECPSMNFGVSAIGLCILDVDVKKGKNGIEELLELGELPRTLKVRTGTGGLHIYFTSANVGQRNIRPAIEIRSHGGYVVGPGSVVDGNTYTVLNDAVPVPLPETLRFELAKAPERDDNAGVAVGDLDTDAAIETAIAFLKGEPSPDSGARNNTVFRVACQLKDIGLSPLMIKEVIVEHWYPRWDDTSEFGEAEIETIAHNAHKSGRHAAGSSNPELEFGDVVRELPGVLPDLFKLAPAPKSFGFEPWYQDRDPAQIPRRPWLIPNLVLLRSLTGLVAEPGARKSTLTMGIGAGLAVGTLKHLGLELGSEQALGFDLREGTRVLIVNNEDDADEKDRRLAATCLANGLDYRQATRNLHWHNPENDMPFMAMKRDPKTRALRVTKIMEVLLEYVEKHNIKVVIFDPLAETHEGSENDNSEMARVMALFRAVVRMKNMAGLIVHHTSKQSQTSDAGYAGKAASARGATSIVGNVRVLATLCTATQQDGFGMGLTGDQFLAYSRLDIGKGSYLPPGPHTRWYRAEGVHVGLDGVDSAPAFKYVNASEQVQRMKEMLHTALVDLVVAADNELPLSDAVDAAISHLPTMTLVEAEGILRAMFTVPFTSQGTSLAVEGTGKKAKMRAF